MKLYYKFSVIATFYQTYIAPLYNTKDVDFH